jgi:hypothetical protein
MNETPITVVLLCFAYAAGACVVSSWLMWWFITELPTHVFSILRFLGLKKKDDTFWSKEIIIGEGAEAFPVVQKFKDLTKDERDEWMSDNLYPFFSGLLTCPGCLSMHISFWTALCVSVFLWFCGVPIFFLLLFFYLAWFGWPSIGNFILNKIYA